MDFCIESGYRADAFDFLSVCRFRKRTIPTFRSICITLRRHAPTTSRWRNVRTMKTFVLWSFSTRFLSLIYLNFVMPIRFTFFATVWSTVWPFACATWRIQLKCIHETRIGINYRSEMSRCSMALRSMDLFTRSWSTLDLAANAVRRTTVVTIHRQCLHNSIQNHP